MTTLLRFNIVGVLGFGLQLGVLVILEAAGMPIALATLIAVEAAVLHNFVWHEHWTWAGTAAGTSGSRLVRFHLANGLTSLVGNTIVTSVLVHAGVHVAIANVVAVLACMAANFTTAHLWVFCATTWPTSDGHLH